jgi:excisionase family DNA binding protein
MKKFLIGYAEAAEYTGIPIRRLERMVERREIRVIKAGKRSVYFHPEHLIADIMKLEQPAIW